MASRLAARFVSRRMSSSGKVLSEEERAAENVYIKKTEQEKLEKLARKGPKPEDKPTASSGDPITSGASTPNVSDDKYRNYATVTAVVTGLVALGWYFKGKKKYEETEEK